MNVEHVCMREFDFALVLGGITELTPEVEKAFFEAGCDDATISVTYGRIWMEFSRSAPSYDEAIVSAIRDVNKTGVGARVLRVDECNLVTQAEIARKLGRSRQYVHQLMTGQRGPGGFPPPDCHLTEGVPVWAWCAVSHWLYDNSMIKAEEYQQAEFVHAINFVLDDLNGDACRIDPKQAQELKGMLGFASTSS